MDCSALVTSLYDGMKYNDYIKNNTLYLEDEITMDSINMLSRQLKCLAESELLLDKNDRKPIKIIISCYGGEARSTFYFCDLMEYYINKGIEIYTYTTSMAYSGAFKIAICGSKRFAYKRSHFMCHQQLWMDNMTKTYTDEKRSAERSQEMFDTLVEIITSHTKITREMFESYAERNNNFFMNSKEALKYGVIDKILE